MNHYKPCTCTKPCLLVFEVHVGQQVFIRNISTAATVGLAFFVSHQADAVSMHKVYGNIARCDMGVRGTGICPLPFHSANLEDTHNNTDTQSLLNQRHTLLLHVVIYIPMTFWSILPLPSTFFPYSSYPQKDSTPPPLLMHQCVMSAVIFNLKSTYKATC